MKHVIEYTIGQSVYLKTDIEQDERIVTAVILRPNNAVLYQLSCGLQETAHWAIELSTEMNQSKKMKL